MRFWRGLVSTATRLNARWGRQAGRVLRWGVPILLLAYLGYCLTRLGWALVWKARPGGLLFYAAVLLQFYIQPLADLIIYRRLLGVGRALSLLVLLRKRYVNTLLDYSGEVYFFFWAKKNLESKKGVLVHAVKDTNVLSASAGLVMVWLALLAVVVGGSVRLPALAHGGLWTFLGLGSLPLVLVLALFFGGRRVTALSRRDILVTFAIQVARSFSQIAAEFAVWWLSGALPSAALCVQFVALRVVVTRLPLVPNKELVFIGVGIAAAGFLDVSAPKVAAVLVLMTAANLIQNLALVGLPWLFEQFQVRRRADQAAS
jgi:hypothetical protein